MVLPGTASVCHRTIPVSGPSLHPQAAASRAQAVGAEASENVHQAAEPLRSERQIIHHLREDLTQWFTIPASH